MNSWTVFEFLNCSWIMNVKFFSFTFLSVLERVQLQTTFSNEVSINLIHSITIWTTLISLINVHIDTNHIQCHIDPHPSDIDTQSPSPHHPIWLHLNWNHSHRPPPMTHQSTNTVIPALPGGPSSGKDGQYWYIEHAHAVNQNSGGPCGPVWDYCQRVEWEYFTDELCTVPAMNSKGKPLRRQKSRCALGDCEVTKCVSPKTQWTHIKHCSHATEAELQTQWTKMGYKTLTKLLYIHVNYRFLKHFREW